MLLGVRASLLVAAACWATACGQEGYLVTGSATGATTEGTTTGQGGAGADGGSGAAGAVGNAGGVGPGGAGAGGSGQGGTPGVEDCANGVDDDGDGDVDCADSDCASTPVCSGLVLNEVDYDQVGADNAEFVEVYNPGAAPVVLDGLSLTLINGTNGMSYDSTALTGTLPAGGYLVVADAGTVVDPGAIVIFENNWSIQQGPDAVVLYDNGANAVIDALSYGGDIGMVMLGGQMVSLVDGTPTSATDPGVGALARSPNGSDTKDDAKDWVLVPVTTPGAANP
jgi:hypothetical protein